MRGLFLLYHRYMYMISRGFDFFAAIFFVLWEGPLVIFLFHTHATQWASLSDVTPIGLFILLYLYAVGRQGLGWPRWGAALGMLAFVPFAAVVVPLIDRLPFFGISNFYWTVPILLVAYAPFVARIAPATARGMLIGAAILTLSICLRSLDLILCDVWPIGTHIFWHTLNAIMLPLMIEVYRRHRLAHPVA